MEAVLTAINNAFEALEPESAGLSRASEERRLMSASTHLATQAQALDERKEDKTKQRRLQQSTRTLQPTKTVLMDEDGCEAFIQTGIRKRSARSHWHGMDAWCKWQKITEYLDGLDMSASDKARCTDELMRALRRGDLKNVVYKDQRIVHLNHCGV